MTERPPTPRADQADLPTAPMDPVELEDTLHPVRTRDSAANPPGGSGPAGSDQGGSNQGGSNQGDSDSGSTRRLVSATALMAAGTMSSRILGFVRVMLLAALFANGTNQADMFELATVIPTSLYILFAGGALNTVLVPQIVRAVNNDPDGGEAYTNRIMTAFLLLVGAFAVVLTIAAPLVIGVYAADDWKAPQNAALYQSMVFLGYLCLPSVFFYGVFFLLGQVLNAHDRFGPMMWAPIANNVVQVGVLLVYLGVWGTSDGSQPFTTPQALLLGGGATLGIASQTLVMVWFMRKIDFRFRPRFDLRGTGLGHTFHLAKWTLGFVLVNQLALVVVNKLATSATVGGDGAGLAAYGRAYLIWILPHSLITVSLATAMLPSASRLAAAGDLVGVRRETMRTIRLATTVLLPAAAAFIALAMPVTSLMFGQGAGAKDSHYIGWTLIAFAIGLVPFTVQYVCLRAFYALEDTRSTFWQQCVIAALNVLFAIAFVIPVDRPDLVAPGLALAYSLSYVFGLGLSFARLSRRLPGLSATKVIRHLVRVGLAVAPGAVLAWWITTRVGDSMLMQVLGLVGGVLAAVALFFLFARLLRITEVTEIVATLLRRRGRAEQADEGTPAEQAGDTSDETAHLAALEEERDVVSVPFPEGDEEPYAPFVPYVDHDEPDTMEDVEDTAEDVHPVKVRAGLELAGRYRLEEVLVRRATTQTWRAFDEVLSRPVLIHLLPSAEDHDDIMVAARRAAIATDSRFLRVLDVGRPTAEESVRVDSETGEEKANGLGAYIVCEFAPGVSLESLLASGPLSALEAAWLVREVADALAGMHAQGLYHQRISPDTVVITAAGNVKIVGFLLEAEMSPSHHPIASTSDPEVVDVMDIGRLLYCTLVSRWPGGHAYGMASAPTDNDGQLFTPRQVRAGVSPALDRICDQILSDLPRGKEAPLRTAAEVADELGRVLGTADASHDLERRMRYPVPVVQMDEEEPIPAQSPMSAYTQADTADMYFGGAQVSADQADADAPTQGLAAVATPASAGEPTVNTGIAPGGGLTGRSDRSGRSPASPPRPPGSRPSMRRPWITRLVVLGLVVLIGSLVAVALQRNPRTPQTAPTPTPRPAPTALALVSATDFDPQGDSREENRAQAPLAIDGKPETAWTTVTYRNPTMDKDGVGIIVDLGRPVSVAEAKVLLKGTGTTFDLRVPATGADTRTTPPTDSVKDWTSVASVANAGESAEVKLDQPVVTRFVLVNLTQLPKTAQGHQGGVAEVTFAG
ncbi:murein biosynthesis integral membrane protein MurJ [Mariniluteicoccus flavus]